jgi:hypothetical protein
MPAKAGIHLSLGRIQSPLDPSLRWGDGSSKTGQTLKAGRRLFAGRGAAVADAFGREQQQG